MNDNNEVRAIIQDTLVLLDEGWGQGKYYDTVTKCYCVAGAVWNAADKRGSSRLAVERTFEVIAGKIKSDVINTPEDKVICWNDRVGRTKAEVVELLGNAYAFTCLMDQDDRELNNANE